MFLGFATTSLEAKKTMEGANNLLVPEFVIFVPSFNNEKYAESNLKSICFQESNKPYNVICVDDCSTDKTGVIMEEFVKRYHLEAKVTIIHNEKNKGGMANHYDVIHTIPDHKIVVCVDGDDRLPHNKVLRRLEKEYRDPNVWLTYGTIRIMPANKLLSSKHVPDYLFLNKQFRTHPWVTLALRTFKAGLFKKIKKEDLMHEGIFFPVAWDLAMMFPMLEMCGPLNKNSRSRFRHIKDVLYLYTGNNPISDWVNRSNKQALLAEIIRSKPPYEPLERL